MSREFDEIQSKTENFAGWTPDEIWNAAIEHSQSQPVSREFDEISAEKKAFKLAAKYPSAKTWTDVEILHVQVNSFVDGARWQHSQSQPVSKEFDGEYVVLDQEESFTWDVVHFERQEDDECYTWVAEFVNKTDAELFTKTKNKQHSQSQSTVELTFDEQKDIQFIRSFKAEDPNVYIDILLTIIHRLTGVSR